MLVGVLILLVLVTPPVALLTYLALTRDDKDYLPAKSATDFFTDIGGPGGGI